MARIIPLDHFRIQGAANPRSNPVAATPLPAVALPGNGISGPEMRNSVFVNAIAPVALQNKRMSAPTISLQSFYPVYEAYGSRTVGVGAKGVEVAAETVHLVGQSPYMIAASFGMSDPRGEIKVDILDPAEVAIRSLLSGQGKTRALVSVMPMEGGIFTIRLSGQTIPGTEENVRIYGSYQIVVTRSAEEDAILATEPAAQPRLDLVW